jgi:PPOX class probable F420-dependent enzyme
MVALSASASRKLNGDLVAWLTTVRRDGSPATRPVWFVWDEPEILVYSEPGTYKVRHLRRDPRANVHFNSDAGGGTIVVLDVIATVSDAALAPSSCSGYLTKYADAIERLGVSVAEYDVRFSTLVRLTVRRCVDTADTLGSE